MLTDGIRDIPGLWIEYSEDAKSRMRVFNDLKTRGAGDIAAVLNRAPSTISRERHRNAAKAVGIAPVSPHATATAHRSCQQRQRAGRPLAKLHPDLPMFEVVRRLLGQHWSSEQIALTLAVLYPKGHEYRVSTETIYNCLYAQPVGALKRELVAYLRHAHKQRVPCSKGGPPRPDF